MMLFPCFASFQMSVCGNPWSLLDEFKVVYKNWLLSCWSFGFLWSKTDPPKTLCSLATSIMQFQRWSVGDSSGRRRGSDPLSLISTFSVFKNRVDFKENGTSIGHLGANWSEPVPRLFVCMDPCPSSKDNLAHVFTLQSTFQHELFHVCKVFCRSKMLLTCSLVGVSDTNGFLKQCVVLD